MQSTENLDSQLKEMKSKAKPEAPWGFALIPESEDGTPALFLAKTEAMARKKAKDELKVAKKKALITGLIYEEGGALKVLPGMKKLKEPVIIKYWKKLKQKKIKLKALFNKAPEFMTGAVVEDDFPDSSPEDSTSKSKDKKTKSTEPESSLADPKYLEILEKLESKLEDLKNERQEIASLYQKVASVFQASVAEASPGQLEKLEKLSAKLETVAKACQDLDASMQEFKTVVTINDKSSIKKLGRQLQEGIKENEKILEEVAEALDSFDIATGGNASGEDKPLSEMSNIEIYLKQARSLRASSTVQDLITNNPEPGFFDKLFSNRNKKIKSAAAELDQLIEKLELLLQNENNDKGVSAKQEKEVDKELFTLRKKFSDLLVEAKLPKSGSVSDKVAAVWAPALRQSQAELQRFKSAVFAHPVVTSDPSFAVIQSKVSQALITFSDLKGEGSKSEIKKKLKGFKDSNEMNQWKEIDSSSLFGNFSVAHPMLQAIETLSKL